MAFLLINALNLQAVCGVVDHVAMGEEGEVLEHHGRFLPTEGLQVGPSKLLDIDSIDQDTAMGHGMQLVHRPDGRRLA